MIRCFLIVLGGALPAAANAHGAGGAGLVGGLLHPLTGFDHVVIMLAAGLVAARWSRSSVVLSGWAAALLLGFASGAWWPELVREGWMVAALLAAAAAIALTRKSAFSVVPALLGGALFAQGLIHGAEAPAATAVSFGMGFLLLSGVFMAAVASAARLAGAALPSLQQAIGWLALVLGLSKLVL